MHDKNDEMDDDSVYERIMIVMKWIMTMMKFSVMQKHIRKASMR